MPFILGMISIGDEAYDARAGDDRIDGVEGQAGNRYTESIRGSAGCNIRPYV
jgi:hypothetical protein